AEGTPVIVHEGCAVLAAQVGRAGGGAAVSDYEEFAAALDDLWLDCAGWRRRGLSGRAYVGSHYSSTADYRMRLLGAIEQMRKPLGEQMTERGVQGAGHFSRGGWQERFGAAIDAILTQPARPVREGMLVEPLRSECRVAASGTLLVPVRLTNGGSHAAVA